MIHHREEKPITKISSENKMNESDACPMKLKKRREKNWGEIMLLHGEPTSEHGRQESDSERERGKKS